MKDIKLFTLVWGWLLLLFPCAIVSVTDAMTTLSDHGSSTAQHLSNPTQRPASWTVEPADEASTDMYHDGILTPGTLTTAADDVTGKATRDRTTQMILDASQGLYKYGMTVIFVLGAVGNTLALVVFLKGSMRNTSSVLYLITLAVIDQIVIFAAVLGSHVIRSFTGFDYIRYHRSTCKIAYFIIVTGAQTSFYLVACMSMERALITWKPFKFMTVFSRRKTKWIILINIVVWVAKNVPMFWTQGAVYKTVSYPSIVEE